MKAGADAMRRIMSHIDPINACDLKDSDLIEVSHQTYAAVDGKLEDVWESRSITFDELCKAVMARIADKIELR